MNNGKIETSIIFKSVSQMKETLHAIYDLAGINKISLSEALLEQMHCFYWGGVESISLNIHCVKWKKTR